MVGVLAAAPAELGELELLGVGALVLRRGVVALPTVHAFQGDDDSLSCHGCFFPLPFGFAYFFASSGRILVTTPAPTVLPPSRIANRRPSSQAIGVMSSIF